MVTVTACTGGWCDTAAVLGVTIKLTHVITTTDWKEFVLTMISFYSKSCPFSADIIGLRVLTWNPGDLVLFHVSHSLPLRQVCCCCGEFSLCWFWCFQIARYRTQILYWNLFMIIQCHNELNKYSMFCWIVSYVGVPFRELATWLLARFLKCVIFF